MTAELRRIRLIGAVQLQHDRQLAAETAWTAQGVTKVQNLITVV